MSAWAESSQEHSRVINGPLRPGFKVVMTEVRVISTRSLGIFLAKIKKIQAQKREMYEKPEFIKFATSIQIFRVFSGRMGFSGLEFEMIRMN